jgi:hypothetical protein
MLGKYWNAMDTYGLRGAKKIVREVRSEVKGDTGSYAKGFRDALRHVEQDINRQIEEIKKANSTS